MGVLDIDERIEVADKKASLYLRWKAEDDEFQSKHPTGQIYKWFSEHTKHWGPKEDIVTAANFSQEAIETGFSNPIDWTPLEVEYGRPHLAYGPGPRWYNILFLCEPDDPIDLKTPPRDAPSGSPSKLTLYTKMMRIDTYKVKGLCMLVGTDGDPTEVFEIRFPNIIDLRNVQEWPAWLVNPHNRQLQNLWQGTTFWLCENCNEEPIERLIYHPGTSFGDPAEYNFFRASDYFLTI